MSGVSALPGNSVKNGEDGRDLLVLSMEAQDSELNVGIFPLHDTFSASAHSQIGESCARVQRRWEGLRHPIHTIVGELVHPSPCTRRRALGKLQCALASDILTTCDSENDTTPLLRSLLEWFNLPVPSHEILVLSILSRLAQDDENRKLLVDLGAVEFMEEYQRDCCQTVLPYVISLLHNLLKQNSKLAENRINSVPLSDTGLGYVVSSTQEALQGGQTAGLCKERDDGNVLEPIGEQIHCKSQDCNLSCDSCVGNPEMRGNSCVMSLDTLRRNDQFREREVSSQLDENSESIEGGQVSRSLPSGVTSANVLEHVAAVSCQPCSSCEDVLGPILTCIGLEENDDKYLLNLNVTLQYLNDREVLLTTLKELGEAVVFDFHPEAILQKYSIVQSTFLLLQKLTDRNLEQMVFDFLLELVRQIKGALRLSREPGFRVHLEREFCLQDLRESASLGHVKDKSSLQCSYPIHLNLSGHTVLDISGEVVRSRAGEVSNSKGNIQTVISLGRTMHLVVLQLISLLVNERQWDMAFSVLYELLPLIKPSADTHLDGKVRVHFAKYFDGLCEVVQVLSVKSDGLEMLCKEVATKWNFDKSAHHCLPLLRVLIFSAELLFLLQPSHVAGLLPSPLVKGLVTLAGDLILSDCTFGTQKKILPYLKILSPEFSKSYTCATEAAFTLHSLVKVLASSEEVVAQWKAKIAGVRLSIKTELLLKCMIQAIPKCAYFNYQYLIPRLLGIIPDILRINLVKTCKQSADGGTESEGCVTQPPLEGVISQARSLVWLLLSHSSALVRKVTYDSLIRMSLKERQQAQQPSSKHKSASALEAVHLVGCEGICFDSNEPDCLLYHRDGALLPLSILHRLLVFGTSSMGEIIAVGLHDPATCKQSAGLLLHLVEELTESDCAQIIPVYPWIACCMSTSPHLEPMVERFHSVLFQRKSSRHKGSDTNSKRISLRLEWVELSCILRSLFSSCSTQRCKAATNLLNVMRSWFKLEETVVFWWLRRLCSSGLQSAGDSQRPDNMLFDDTCWLLKDPFQQCLQSQDATLFSLAFQCPMSQEIDSGSFGLLSTGKVKTEDLTSLVKDSTVAETVRKSAAGQLTWLIQDQSLRTILAKDEELFKVLILEIVNWMTKGSLGPKGSIEVFCSERMDTSEASPTDLGITCLSFLGRLASASVLSEAGNILDMLLADSGKILRLLIPLVFHPSKCVRREMCLIIAFCLFSSDQLFKGLEEVLLHHDQTPSFSTVSQEILGKTLNSAFKDMQIRVPSPFIAGNLFPCQVVPMAVKSTTLQSSAETLLVDEQLVHRVIAQSVLLEGGHENLLNSLEDRGTSGINPLRTIELQAKACLSVLHADVTLKNLLKLLADPQLFQRCGLETQILGEIEVLCFRHPEAARILAKTSWVLSFQHILTRMPSTPEEFTQLLKVLRLVQMIIKSNCAGSPDLLFLTIVSRQILLPLLAKSPTPKVGSNVHHAIVLIEGYPAFDMGLVILKVFVDILLCSMEHEDASLFGRVATSLAKGTNLLSVLLSKFINGPNAPYICCVLAVQCLSLVTKGISAALGRAGSEAVTRTQGFYKETSSEPSSEQGDVGMRVLLQQTDALQESESLRDNISSLWSTIGSELVQVVLPLIRHMAHLHSHHCLSLRHKQLIREIVSCLWSVTSCVPPPFWEDIWSSTGITYWLSRLLDDQEATIRGMGFGILALLASPVTVKTRVLLEQNWPELGEVAVQTVLNIQECYAVREQALCFILSATTWTTSVHRYSSTFYNDVLPAGFDAIDGLGVNAALLRYKFWMLFPTILQESSGTPGFYRVLLQLTLNVARSDVNFLRGKICANPLIFQALLKQLEFGMTIQREKLLPKCLHSSDTYAAKASVGKILSILAQQEDGHMQSLLQDEPVLEKLLCALSFCLRHRSCESSGSGDGKTELGSLRLEIENVECKGSYCLDHYEQLEAILHLSEALNLVVSGLLQAAQQPMKLINHIRVEDLMSLDLREGKTQEQQARRAAPFHSGFQRLIGRSGVCRDLSSFLSEVSLTKNLQTAANSTVSVLLKKMQLAICALVATLFSEEHLAKIVLENGAMSTCDIPDHQKSTDLALTLYNSFLLIMNDVHKLSRQPKISQDGILITYLRTMLFTVGAMLQNLLAFSSQAKEFAVSSDLPTRLMELAHESYALLGSSGLAPLRNILTMSLSLSSTDNHSLRHCNKVPRRRLARAGETSSPSVWSRNKKQGKLSDSHRCVLLGELIICFRLLKSLVFENARAVETSVSNGVLDFVRSLWNFALAEDELLHEILGLLCNLAAQNDAAKEVVASQSPIGAGAGGQGGSLMDYAMAIVLRSPSNQMSYTLAVGLVQTLVTTAKARAVFLRKQYLSDLLQHYGKSVHNNDILRQHLILQIMINLSVFPNGQKMLCKELCNGSMLDLVLDSIEHTSYVPSSSAAFVLLRNLAFYRETRFFFLSNERILPLLVKSLGSSSLEVRANASSALWILTLTERRIISMLRRIDACPSLVTAHGESKLHVKFFEAHEQTSTKTCGRGTCPVATIVKMGKLVRHIEQENCELRMPSEMTTNGIC